MNLTLFVLLFRLIEDVKSPCCRQNVHLDLYINPASTPRIVKDANTAACYAYLGTRLSSMTGRVHGQTIQSTRREKGTQAGASRTCCMPLSIRSSMRFLDSCEMTGPTSQPGSCPAVTFNAFALLIRASLYLPMPPTNTAAEMAMQRCPAAPMDAPMRADAVASGLASGMTTAWFLAPLFACHNHGPPSEAAWIMHSTNREVSLLVASQHGLNTGQGNGMYKSRCR